MSKKKVSEATSHLRVAIRVRPMNKTEKDEKCTNIVKVDQQKLTITCKGKGFGPFTKVYGPDVTQSMVYEDLVASQVKNVIAGFNCTVFAYGQTGTGKTFTMEGGRSEAKSSDEDETTGIIPRAVEDIFLQLEKSGCEEYSLRVSYLELYNEELFDLLAINSDGDDRERLRIFDDPNKKGVIVSGVEEVPVRNRADVYKLLEMGAEKRRTAATLMNMHSSRSHSLFMVNVVIRENTTNGEELVKQGKLNLVDLAGSENIGRSGAQGNRAKEAGSINQSLLTLGRVIRSLTTNAQHIPYRESKLTRLLQDSLGGSTITSLIATLSPASSNFEESQSTLEYAMRAANIKNKPICNTKVSKKTILKEYSEEIEKLRRDLRAAREKNGVIISEESHEEFQRNMERVRDLEDQLGAVTDRLYRFTEDLMHMDDQYRQLYEHKTELADRLNQRLRDLAEKEKELADTRDELKIYVDALEEMHSSALRTYSQLQDMRNVADDYQGDLVRYWKKVDAMSAAAVDNKGMIEKYIEKIGSSITRLLENNRRFSDESTANVEKVVENSKIPCEFLAETSSKLQNESQSLTMRFSEFSQLSTTLHNEAIERINNEHEDLKKDLNIKMNSLMILFQRYNKEASLLGETASTRLNNIQEAMDGFRKEIDPLLSELRVAISDSMDRHEKDRQEISTSVAQPCADIFAELENLRKDFVERIGCVAQKAQMASQKAVEINSRQEIDDQESLRKVLETMSIVQDVVTSNEDVIGEEVATFNDTEKVATQEELNAISDEAEVGCSEINTQVENHVTSVKSATEELEEKNALNLKQLEEKTQGGVERLNSIVADCGTTIESTESRTTDAVAVMNESKNRSENAVVEITGEMRESSEAVKLVEVDPYECVPSRTIRSIYTVDELNVPPQPEKLVSRSSSSSEEGEDDVSARKKRRVTTFMRRDSLLDATNKFMSPTSIQRRREAIIEEDDFEN
ncbi:unnamed protein product [Caenorhabditis bovis]|uniref:Kinesin-like protein n=1 Tax=Caenorhabditis bovis TaxID=2654633 RepID=A0A8S1F860_9PELO|nr:unnamed protein product [Caenorhabditis bovis]